MLAESFHTREDVPLGNDNFAELYCEAAWHRLSSLHVELACKLLLSGIHVHSGDGAENAADPLQPPARSGILLAQFVS